VGCVIEAEGLKREYVCFWFPQRWLIDCSRPARRRFVDRVSMKALQMWLTDCCRPANNNLAVVVDPQRTILQLQACR